MSGAGNGPALQEYGDNVAAATEGAFSHGGDGGFTSNLEVGYASATGGALTFWTTGDNNLVNVVENEADGQSGYSITFITHAGLHVVLSSLNIGN